MTAALHSPCTGCERRRKEVEAKIDRLLGGAGQEDLS